MKPKVKIIFSFLICLLFATQVLAAGYQVKTLDPEQLKLSPVTLPDISKFSSESIERLLAAAWSGKKGKVFHKMVYGQVEMRMLYSGKGLFNMGVRQKNLPTALVIEGGVMTLQEVSRAFPRLLVHLGGNEYLAKLPIAVAVHGTLIIKDTVLKLSQERGAFLVNGGVLFLQGGALLGWRESSNSPALYTGDQHAFRPFFVGFGRSRTYFNQTKAAHLGYLRTKSYGITLTSYLVKKTEKVFQRQDVDLSWPPSGLFLNSYFSDIYYGFYCYEAENIAIINNTYEDNVVYGIDPHDMSSLIIAGNTIYDTRIKHGIILSRKVNNSFIFNNKSYDNKLSGIVLDRQSSNNHITGNIVYGNGSDGITLYESGDNLVAENVVYDNGAHGIRLRNSENIILRDNIILNNGSFGVYLHTRDLAATGLTRDMKIDPYRQAVSAVLVGGILSGNRSGSVFAQNVTSLSLYNTMIDTNGGKKHQLKFGGDLKQYHNQIVQSLWGEHGVAVLSKDGEQ